MSIASIGPIFAEPVEVEIDWLIEGQTKITAPSSTIEPIDKIPIVDEQNNNFVDDIGLTDSEPYVDFITGSGYMIGNRIIDIDSKEGQILNQILIEQKEINRDNFFHMIN